MIKGICQGVARTCAYTELWLKASTTIFEEESDESSVVGLEGWGNKKVSSTRLRERGKDNSKN
jgi:hypothetical protein